VGPVHASSWTAPPNNTAEEILETLSSAANSRVAILVANESMIEKASARAGRLLNEADCSWRHGVSKMLTI
jgi:hypothetical protein